MSKPVLGLVDNALRLSISDSQPANHTRLLGSFRPYRNHCRARSCFDAHGVQWLLVGFKPGRWHSHQTRLGRIRILSTFVIYSGRSPMLISDSFATVPDENGSRTHLSLGKDSPHPRSVIQVD